MNYKQINSQYYLAEAEKWKSGQYVKVFDDGYFDLEEYGLLGRIWLRIRARVYEITN